MLEIAYHLRDLHFSSLMDVYFEGNEEHAAREYPYLDANEGRLCAERDFYQYLQECFFAADDAVYAMWKVNGKIVSALRLEPYQDGWLLEALETAPQYRRKGFAEDLVRAVLEWCEQNGRLPVYSHIDRKNTASLRTHEKCGFVCVLDHAVEIDGSVSRNACTMKFS